MLSHRISNFSIQPGPLSESEIPASLEKMKKNLRNLSEFSAGILAIVPSFPEDTHAFLAASILSTMLVRDFSKRTTLKQKIKAHLSSLIKFIKKASFTTLSDLQISTQGLILSAKEIIEKCIKEVLKPSQVFILLICTELFQKLQRFPLPLLVCAVMNCTAQASNIKVPEAMPSVYSLLSSPTSPFLPSYSHKEYTLVLDLDETLGHFNKVEFLLRPGASQFLKEMRKTFELVLFTAANRDYADWAMEKVDPNGYVQLRLYRQHTVDSEIKDLERLGRDLNRVIIVDNFSKSFAKQPMNGIEINSWLGDEKDRELEKLSDFLSAIPVPDCSLQEMVASINASLKSCAN